MKTQVEIERLLHWTYRDELPKRGTSSAEGIWDRLAQNGSLGGIDGDPGHGSAQRYPHFGLPHPDAETTEGEVGALPDATIDWATESEIILGHLLALADTRPLAARSQTSAQKVTTVGYRDRHRDNLGWRTEKIEPRRDVIMVRTLRTSALVTMHACMGSRPDWKEEGPRPCYIEPENGPKNRAKIIGECRAKDHYTTGTYCPIEWRPSPISIALARADYLAWWRGLKLLSDTLKLAAHEVLPPIAPQYPWNDPPQQRSVYTSVHVKPMLKLPLAPQRDRAGPPPSRPRHGLVTTITERT